jgi:methylmalonyl-CoA mutase cobalamin-binding domain/chain
MMAFEDLKQAVIDGDVDAVPQLTQKYLDEGKEAGDILDNGLIPAMDTIGDLFGKGDLFIPEMLISAEAMQEGLALLKPLLVEGVSGGKGTVVMGAVKGDLHDIGKNLVVLMLEGAGFNVVDLGTSVEPEDFVAAAKEHGANVVGMSALLVTTMPQMRKTVEAMHEAGVAAKVIVGGAPLTQAYADEIQADGYASDAPGAVVLCKALIA